MIQQNYEYDFTGDLRAHDIEARNFLSTYAYKEYWVKVIQKRTIANTSCAIKEDIILYSQL